jgi:hypothetical protein
MWHIHTTVIRLLDGSRAYLHAVIAAGRGLRGSEVLELHESLRGVA